MASLPAIFLVIVAALGTLYQLLAAVAVWRFRHRDDAGRASLAVGVTILKPLHGDEPGLYENLRGFCLQEYAGSVQVVFGVQNPLDSALVAVKRLQAEFPKAALSLVIGRTSAGGNAKVSNLISMMSVAAHEVLVVADSDMIVPKDYLARLVPALQRPGVGLVTCLYTGQPALNPRASLWARLGAAHINYGFMPSVMVAALLGGSPGCYGATMALTRTTLARLGGFEAIADQLADDYALGVGVRRLGLKVALSEMVVATSVDEPTVGQLLRHELRWARTIRRVAPAGYAGALITHTVPVALLALLWCSFATMGWIALLAAVAARIVLVSSVDRCYNAPLTAPWALLARDLLSFGVALASYAGARVTWRDATFQVHSDGRMVLSEDEAR